MKINHIATHIRTLPNFSTLFYQSYLHYQNRNFTINGEFNGEHLESYREEIPFKSEDIHEHLIDVLCT